MAAEKEIRKRSVAFICKIHDLITNDFVKEEGAEFAPSYVLCNGEKIARANVIGVVVDKEEKSLVIDDGTAKIRLRAFENTPGLDNFLVGDIVNVIGKIREFNNERYLMPEIMKKTTKKWLELRKMQLQGSATDNKKTEDAEEVEDVKKPLTKAEEVLSAIRKFDSGEGAAVELILSKVGNDAENIINGLLRDGEIFEIRPGRLKVLE